MPDTSIPSPAFPAFFHKLLWVLVLALSSLMFAWASHVETKLTQADQLVRELNIRLVQIDTKLDLLLQGHNLSVK